MGSGFGITENLMFKCLLFQQWSEKEMEYVKINLNYRLQKEDRIMYSWNKKKLNCERDPRFKLLYKIREDIFYMINDSNDLAEKLPEFQINGNYLWGLYNIGYIPWKV